MIPSPAKTTEPIDMQFGLWTWVSLKKHVLDGSRYPMQRGDLNGDEAAHYKVGLSTVSCAKTVEPIEMLFGM